MTTLPPSLAALLVRVDYSNDSTWQAVRDAVLTPAEPGWVVSLAVIEGQELADQDFTELVSAPEGYEARVLVVFDRETQQHADNPLLVIDWLADIDEHDEDRYIPRSMRATPDQVQSIETNLELANMDFEDFADAADADGIFRGFR